MDRWCGGGNESGNGCVKMILMSLPVFLAHELFPYLDTPCMCLSGLTGRIIDSTIGVGR